MLKFVEDGHKYLLDGVEMPSVTQICKPLTVDVAERAKPWLRDAAAKRGSDIHEICADIDIGEEGGKDGGNIVAFGTPEEVAAKNKGYTAAFLKSELNTQL